MEASHRVPCLDYDDILNIVSTLTRDCRQVEAAFRLMAFNVFSHNKDDHVKNFAFLCRNGEWVLSPAFDLTFSRGMSNQHISAINGSGNPTIRDIEKIVSNHSIKNWSLIIDEGKNALAELPVIANGLGAKEVDYKVQVNAMHHILERMTH